MFCSMDICSSFLEWQAFSHDIFLQLTSRMSKKRHPCHSKESQWSKKINKFWGIPCRYSPSHLRLQLVAGKNFPMFFQAKSHGTWNITLHMLEARPESRGNASIPGTLWWSGCFEGKVWAWDFGGFKPLMTASSRCCFSCEFPPWKRNSEHKMKWFNNLFNIEPRNKRFIWGEKQFSRFRLNFQKLLPFSDIFGCHEIDSDLAILPIFFRFTMEVLADHSTNRELHQRLLFKYREFESSKIGDFYFNFNLWLPEFG